MTIGTHIAEIFRQGIWASLTGGWYYEPAYSNFCNVVHLYLWLLFFLLPLLLGLSINARSSYHLVVAYTAFTFIVFAVLKFIVAYLHNLFDTTEPIVYSRKQSTAQSIDRVLNTSSQVETSQDDGGIEMVEMNMAGNSSETDVGIVKEMQDASSKRPRVVRIDEVGEASNIEESHLHTRRNDFENRKDRDPSRWHTSFTPWTIMPADSLELLRMENRYQTDADGRSRSAIVRKLSEPCLEVSLRGSWTRSMRRRLSDSGDSRVRRAKSAFETTMHPNSRSGTLLSQRTLEECKKKTRKSYPSKMSSTSAFLSDGLATKRDELCPSLSFSFPVPPTSTAEYLTLLDAIKPKDNEKSEMDEEEDEEEANEDEDETRNESSDSSCAQASSENFTSHGDACVQSSNDDNHIGHSHAVADDKNVQLNTACDQIPSTSAAGWSPVFVSVGDLDLPSTSKTHSVVERVSKAGSDLLPIIGGMSDGVDLKGEIAKFLEELIDKHPETLDAIESVRKNRLGRNSSVTDQTSIMPPPSTTTATRLRRMDRESVKVAALSSLPLRDGTHVAIDHEDTSQGAVHSFQDEDGNWWTYAFDDHGLGTAHALGSSRALIEMINNNSSQQRSVYYFPSRSSHSYMSSYFFPEVFISAHYLQHHEEGRK
ncbi:hypothetical protein AB6A40_004734 [Gnathostoma spinigerum]|uniref:Pecanex-like protein n=1 Tax=Gnathostoma spinigerum TaxID=75299 RepID=A0ABD6EEI0_9BILA